MSKSANVTLYHANACKHCVDFMPEWEKLIEKNIDNISCKSYEASQIEAQNATVNGNPLLGYPTIKITIDKNGKKSEIDYMGKRRADEIINFISEKLK